jgi:uncharacterized SAM-binding protein YcdF (DUF218 family)
MGMTQLIGPPGGPLLLLIGGWFLLRQCRRTGLCLLVGGIVLLYLSSLPFTAYTLMSLLETSPPPSRTMLEAPVAEQPQAIVVLSAGRRERAPEFGGDTLNALGLERLRYGAWLARRTQRPLLLSGGLGDRSRPAEALMMKHVAEREFGIAVRWVEARSRTTFENAQYSAAMLRAQNIGRIYLVTHAWHMPRAVWSFRQFGLEVVPAPTAFESSGSIHFSSGDLLPDARALAKVAFVVHEIVGNFWYRLRYTGTTMVSESGSAQP